MPDLYCTIYVNMTTLPFEGQHSCELADILSELAHRVDGNPNIDDGNSQPVLDSDRNEVGWIQISKIPAGSYYYLLGILHGLYNSIYHPTPLTDGSQGQQRAYWARKAREALVYAGQLKEQEGG